MLLVNAIKVMAKLVHKNVQKHKRARLRLLEPTRNARLPAIIRKTKRLQYLLVRIKIRDRQVCPQLVTPRMEENRPRLLAVVKLMRTIAAITATRQDDALQSLGISMPVWDNVNERLHVPLADNVPEATSRRLAIQNVSVVSGRSVAVFALNTSIFDFRGGASVKNGAHASSHLTAIDLHL